MTGGNQQFFSLALALVLLSLVSSSICDANYYWSQSASGCVACPANSTSDGYEETCSCAVVKDLMAGYRVVSEVNS